MINSPIGLISPFTQILFNSTGNPGLSIFLASLSTYLAFVGGIDAQGSCARTLWAMARDDAFPAPFRSVHPKWEVPVCCIAVSAAAQLAIGAIYIGNSTAFYGLISGVLALYMLTYAMAIGLHTMAKLSGDKQVQYGPWTLGRLSLPLNVVALAWAVFTFIFLCFPLYQPVTAGNM